MSAYDGGSPTPLESTALNFMAVLAQLSLVGEVSVARALGGWSVKLVTHAGSTSGWHRDDAYVAIAKVHREAAQRGWVPDQYGGRR